MASNAPKAPAGAALKGMPKLTFAALIPLVIIHGLSFIAFVIYLAGLAATDRQLRNTEQTSTTRQNVLAFPWFLLVAYAVVMGLHAVVMVVPQLHFLKLTVAILLGITASWFGKSVDDTMSQTRAVEDLDQDSPHMPDLVSGLRCLDAGGVMCTLALIAALVLMTVDYARTGATYAAADPTVDNTAPQVPGSAPPPPGMRQAVCPKCGHTTNYPPEYEAVCCVSCQTVIQVSAAV